MSALNHGTKSMNPSALHRWKASPDPMTTMVDDVNSGTLTMLGDDANDVDLSTMKRM